MRTLIFSLIILCSSICYGQVPVTKDRLLILVVGSKECTLSEEANKHFNTLDVRAHMVKQGIQCVKVNGIDTTPEWRQQNKLTHYPAVVYYMKQDGEMRWVKTYSGPEVSRMVGKIEGVRQLLGMKAETYKMPPPQQRVPSNHPLIPGSNSSPPVQYVAPQPQYQMPPQQQFMNQWQSIPSS